MLIKYQEIYVDIDIFTNQSKIYIMIILKKLFQPP